MTPLIRKEIRLLLPFLIIALLLAAVPAWVFTGENYLPPANEIVFWAFGFGMMLLGLAPFGEEFSMGTFSSLLAQPLRRNRIWLTKLLLVSAAAVLVLLVLIASIHLRLDSILKDVTQRLAETKDNRVWNLTIQKSVTESLHSLVFWRIGFILVLVGLAGGLWTTLLFRQTGAALWFTILVPGIIFFCIDWFVPGNFAREIVSFAILGVYSIAGFVWARRMFLEAQDAQWLGDAISLSGLSRSETETESRLARRQKPWRALLGKEIQLQQINLLIAFGLLVLHFCTLVFRGFNSLPRNSELRFVVESVPLLWLMLPWLLGSAAVAEERKLGTLESQLCLPFSRRRQFAAKFGVVLSLGFVLGAIVPCAIEFVGILCHVKSGVLSNGSLTVNSDAPQVFITLCAIAIGIAILSLLASSLTRNTLHALGAAVVFCGVCAGLLSSINQEIHQESSLWSGLLVYVIGVPISILTVIWLTVSNYKWLHAGRNVWLQNLLILSASLALSGTATAFIYQRPWELMMTLEPRRGSLRLSDRVKPAICDANGRVFGLLPDGRLWASTDFHWKVLDEYEQAWDSGAWQQVRLPIPDEGVFVGGSDWTALAAGFSEVVALQSNGSLWRILPWPDKTNRFNWKSWLSMPLEPRQIGSDTNWQSVAGRFECFVAVKTDGSLWSWGRDPIYAGSNRYIEAPVRIGVDSDWAAVFSREDGLLFMKRNGEIWIPVRDEGKNRDELRKTHLNGSDWLAVAGRDNSGFFLHKDGTLWAQGYFPKTVFGYRNPTWDQSDARETLFRIGDNSDWSQIASGGWLALKKDGRLVENHRLLFSGWLGQPSRHSDWIAIDSSWDGFVALAADGTVSFWSKRGSETLLGPTHRPLWSLNVLTSAE